MVLDHLVIQRMDTSGRTVLGPGAATAAAKQMFGKVRAYGIDMTPSSASRSRQPEYDRTDADRHGPCRTACSSMRPALPVCFQPAPSLCLS